MSDWTFDRAAAMGGIGFVVLAGIASAIAPTTLAIDSSAEEIRSKLAGHADAIGTSALLTALAMLAIGFLLAYVHGRLRSAESRNGSSLPACFALAGTALVTIGLLGAVLQAVVAHHTGGFDDPTLLLTFRLWQMVSYNLSALPAGVMLLLAGVRTLQTGVFPRWLGIIAIVAGLAGLVAVSILYTTGEPAPTVLDAGGFALAGVWMAATGIHAVVRPARSALVATQTA